MRRRCRQRRDARAAGAADREPRAARDGAPVRGGRRQRASSASVAHSDWPPEARALPRVGDANALDLERIVALAPDLVVAWPYTMPAQLAALRARGATMFVSDPKSIAGIARDIEALGTLAGTAATAQPAAAALRARHDALAARYARSAGDFACSTRYGTSRCRRSAARHLISEAIALCGGRNVFAALTLPAPTVSFEAVVAAAAGGDHRRQRRWTAPAPGSTTGSAGATCRPCATAICSSPTATCCIGRGRASSTASRRCARCSTRRATNRARLR